MAIGGDIRPKHGRLRNWLSNQARKDYTPYIVLGLPLLFLFVFLVWPLVKTAGNAFVLRGQQLTFDNLTLENFRRFFQPGLYQRSLYNSLYISLGVVTFTLLAGVPMGYFLARVKMPFKELFLAVTVLPLILPSFVGAFSWIILLGHEGVLRRVINSVLGLVDLSLPPIYGYFGMILTLTLSYYPFVVLLSHGAFQSANYLLEEAAMLMGAERGRILRTITLPLILPSLGAAAILVFIRAIGDFGIPAILGGDKYVLPTLIFFRISGFWDLNGAAAISIVSVAITVFVLWIQRRVVQAREYETVSAARSEMTLLEGPFIRRFAFVYCLLLILISVLPQITLVIMSFFERWIGFLPSGFTLNNYSAIPRLLRGPIANTFFLATSASIIAAIFGSLMAYIIVRRRPKGALLLDIAVMLPFILPGIVVAVSLLTTFSSGPIALGGTFSIIIISYVIRRTPYVFRSASASLSQLDPSLEEASMISGASWWYTFRRVSLPLVLPGIVSGTILTFVTLLTELSTAILLYSARTRTLPIAIYDAVSDGKFGDASALAVLLMGVVFVIVYLMNVVSGRSFSSSFKL